MKHLNTKTQFGFSILPFALCIFLILFSACDNGSGSGSSDEVSSDTGSIAFSLVWEGSSTGERSVVRAAALAAAAVPAAALDCAASGVSTVEATVYDQNDKQLKAGGPWPCDNHQGAISGVPVGDNRKVVILCKDSEGNVLYRGEKPDITMTGGKTTDVGCITVSPETYTLTIVKDSNGSGTVISSPVGINCGTDCTETYDAGTEVTFTATPAEGSAFAGWSGGGCSGTGQCVVTMNADTSITATFTLNTYTVNATAGTGGTIDPSGSVMVNHGADHTFTITPDDGCHVDNVIVDGLSVGAVTTYTFTNVTADHTIEAAFNPWVVWHVDGSVEGSGNGTSWPEAFKTIKEAIDAALGGDEIWIKQGSYNLSDQIEVNKPVAIYAGFDGTESQRDQRDWQNNVTTVDGKNAVRCFNVSADATIDGFTITGGYNSSGAGMYNYTNTAAIITNCSFLENHADYGGGMYNNDASPTVTNCTFRNNSATAAGGGMFNSAAEPMVTTCIFNGNSAKDGGGMYHLGDSSPKVTSCTITGNTATDGGGGMVCYRFASPTITSCTITGNTAPLGGGILCADYAEPTIINCTITDNVAHDYGGGIVCHGYPSLPTITNCILWGNTPDNMLCPATVAYCDIDQDGYEGIDGNIREDPLFVDPTNDDFHLQQGSPCIDAGTSDGAPDKDIDNEERPYGVNVDIGADEHRPPWPMFHNDARHTGRSSYVGPQDEAVLWTYSTDGEVNSSPAIDGNGTIYVGSEDGNLYAINPDGTFKWTFSTKNGIFSSPAIGWDGTIYVGSRDYNLYAISPDGNLKWLYATGGEVNASPTIGQDGTIYIGSYDGKLYALNPDGTLKGEYSAGGKIRSSAAIGLDGVIYVGSYDGRLNALYPDCTLKWISDPPIHGIWTHPAISPDGTAVYHGADDGHLYARNTTDGSLKWKSPVTHGGVQSSPAIGGDGTIYVGTQYGKLWALNPEYGSLKWKKKTNLSARSSPAIGTDGTIYFATTYGHISAMNQDGTVKWVYNGDGNFYSSPAIGSNGTLYIGSTNGMVYAFGKP